MKSIAEVEKAKASSEFKVFISTRESTCGECGENLGRHAWITLAGENGCSKGLICGLWDTNALNS